MRDWQAGILLLLTFIVGLSWMFGGTVTPDLSTESEATRAGGVGHPLWED